MHRFELLPHTADVAIRAEGSSREELLRAAVSGMFAAAEPSWKKGGRKVKRAFRVESPDFSTLVVDIMSEALSQSDVHHEAYEDIEDLHVSDTAAEGKLIGRPVTAYATQIKAVTYHRLTVERKKDGTWEATVVFDV